MFDFDALAAADTESGGQVPTVENTNAVFSIQVRSALSGQILCCVAAGPTTRVSVLKEEIEAEAQIPALEQRLLAGQRRLLDHETLGDVPDVEDDGEIVLLRVDPARAQILTDMKQGRISLAELAEEWCGDEEVVIAGVKASAEALQHATAGMRKRRAVVLAAVQSNPSALRYAEAVFQDDREVVLAAVERSGETLKYASHSLRGDKEIVLAALRQDSMALAHASSELRSDRETVLVAVTSKGMALQHASDGLRNDLEIARAAVKRSWGAAVQHANAAARQNRELMLFAVRLDGLALGLASVELRSDRELVMVAVENNGMSLQYACDNLRCDRELVHTAVRHCGWALQYASEKLRADRELVFTAVKNHAGAFQHASEKLKDNHELALIALRTKWQMLRFAGSSVTSDREIVLAAMRQEPRAICFADRSLICDSLFRHAASKYVAFQDERYAGLLHCLPEAAHDFLVNEDAIFLDAREPHHFEVSHVKGAYLLPDSAAIASVKLADAPVLRLILQNLERTIIVYSDDGGDNKDGNRCALGARELRNSPRIQPHRVLRLFGGLNLWKVRDFPVEGNKHPMFGTRASAGLSDMMRTGRWQIG